MILSQVSYAISLVISNMDVVKPPLINITRQGLIPRQEQVFRLTLPCSGLASAEVDIQILINITGVVATDDQSSIGTTAAAAAEEDSGVVASQADSDTDASMQSDQADNDDSSSSADNTHDNNDSTTTTGDIVSSSMRPMAGNSEKQPISTTLSIKRKKICFVHPVAVTGPAIPAPLKTQPMPMTTSTTSISSTNTNSSSSNNNSGSGSTNETTHQDEEHSTSGNKQQQLINKQQPDSLNQQQQQQAANNNDSKQTNNKQHINEQNGAFVESGATSGASAPIDQSTVSSSNRDSGQQVATSANIATTTTNQVSIMSLWQLLHSASNYFLYILEYVLSSIFWRGYSTESWLLFNFSQVSW